MFCPFRTVVAASVHPVRADMKTRLDSHFRREQYRRMNGERRQITLLILS